ncbi:MAG TPA: helix-turn-helix transcriptional regulator [Solirubrobacteraceae bacterium]|jgi:transcriptional regulator with XRE-family HTH domain|nr:helix-turn-helix transcriptional regulator [Solirubrobacteraceae bacterium]
MRSTGDPDLDEQLVRFGENMREARRRAGLSQIDLSLRANLDRAAVSFLERAERAPDLSTIVRIAGAVGVKPSALLKGIGPDGATVRGPRDSSESSAPAARFGANLRWARERASISQEALANDARVDRAAISVFERGKRNPNLRTLLRLARALELPPGALLRGVEPAVPVR